MKQDHPRKCSRCSSCVLSNQGYACFSCGHPALGCFKWLRNTSEKRGGKGKGKDKLGLLKIKIKEPSQIMECNSQFSFWQTSQNVALTCCIQSFLVPNGNKKIKEIPKLITTYGPFVSDESNETAVSRISLIPSRSRSWCVTLRKNLPVTLFLDLESYGNFWEREQEKTLQWLIENRELTSAMGTMLPKNRKRKNEERKREKEKTVFCPNEQMWAAISFVTEELNATLLRQAQRGGAKELPKPIELSDWWIYSNDRVEQTSSWEKKKKYSRRGYLPDVEFENLECLHQFMKKIQKDLEIKTKSLFENEKGTHSVEKAKMLTNLLLPNPIINKKNFLWTHYIDFSVYHNFRHLRLPTCIKGTGSQYPSLRILQVGSMRWYERYLSTSSAFLSTSRSSLYPILLQSLQSHSFGKEDDNKIDDKIQILSGMITHPKWEDKKMTSSSPRLQILCSDLLSSLEISSPEKRNQIKSQNFIPSQTTTTSQKFKGCGDAKELFSLTQKEEEMFPEDVVLECKTWLKNYGDITSDISVIGYYKQKKKGTERISRLYLLRVASNHEERICWTGAVHQAGRNGGIFLMEFIPRHPQQAENTKVKLSFRCLSQKCDKLKSDVHILVMKGITPLSIFG